MIKIFNLKLSLFLCFVSFTGSIFSQNTLAPVPDLKSPHNAAYVHLYYLQPESYDSKIASLALYPIADSTKMKKLAVQLKQLYDGKGLFLQLNKLPIDPNFIDSSSQRSYFTPFPLELPQIYLEKEDSLWRYSPESVKSISKLHRKVYPLGADFLLKLSPKNATGSFLGLALWQWLGILLLLAAAFLLHLVLSRFIRPFLNMITHSRLHLEFINIDHLKKMARLSSMLLIAWFIRMAIPALLLSINTSATLHKIVSFFVIIISMRIGLLIINIAAERGQILAMNTVSRMDEQLIPILTRIAKLIVISIAILYILRLLNVNVTALIAGISIGGLALALAAQDTVKNLIGSIMIFTDQPFQMGDYIVGGGYEGTVEEIGFRTTRIRTIDTSLVSVPNGIVSNSSINNLGVRPFRLYKIMLGVTYNTPSEKIEAFVEKLRALVLEHPKTRKEAYFVHFNEMADSSLNILFRCQLEVADLAEEYVVKEEMLLQILRIAESLGISFAFPSRSLYIEGDQKLTI